MDTRSRSYSNFKLSKIIAFILVVVSFTSMVLISLDTLKTNQHQMDLLDDPFEKNYFLSAEYGWEVTSVIEDITSLIKYRSEEYIQSGETIDQDEFNSQKEELFNNYLENERNYNENKRSYQDGSYEEIEMNDDNYEQQKKKFEDEHSEEINEIRNKLIKQDLISFKEIKNRLNKNQGLRYLVKQEDIIFSNTNENKISDFKKYPAYVIVNSSGQNFKPKIYEESRHKYWQGGNTGERISDIDGLQIAFTRDYINQKESLWNKKQDIVETTLYKLLSLLSVLILSLIYLIVVTGKDSFKDREIKLNKIDTINTDVNLMLIISIIPIWALMTIGLYEHAVGNLSLILIGLVSATSCVIVLTLLLSFSRHLKNKTAVSNSLVYIVTKKLLEVSRDVYDSGNVGKKVTLAIVVFSLLMIITIYMFPITIGVAIYLANKKVKEYLKIKEGVNRIKNGEIDHKIEIENDGEFKSLASDINSIGEGFNNAIGNELKSERFKTELITNVSHDIRTPLTSIITYIDLIKNEDNKEKIKEYIEVIEQKSHRLKTLTDDLFEASKATSGNIDVNFEKIDLVSLITQGLGELNTEIQETELDFKINNLTKDSHVRADGRLLWRSIENLLTNIFKYSLKGSRVYIDIVDLGESLELNIKNISAYELNISPDELLERFKRGDDSRTSEGSGLGLSISKSLIEAQGGKFDIAIDGDLFKATIILSKYID